MVWWQQLILVITGAMLGSGTSIMTTKMTLRHQAKVEAEKRSHQEQLEQASRSEERNRAAAAAGYAAVTKLMQLREDPSEAIRWQRARRTLSMDDYADRYLEIADQVDAWGQERDHLLLDLRIAIDGFSDEALRNELSRAHLMLELGINLELGGMTESHLREMICNHVLRCLASASLNKPLPEQWDDYARCWRELEKWYDDNDPRHHH
ncbi:hypothetical protein [Nonomuraea sp. bgisy101]|uniref:hypothetical protein n=1 Tax=Nonomuraea sp. bgisy101 TaxID=3413784 RepID=UPI003D730389